MKKTFNINIAGAVFTIDDDAYTLLNEYLDTIENAFSNSDESSELLDDIEARIAELFYENIEKGFQVITLTDVQKVISRIGRPEDMIDKENIEIAPPSCPPPLHLRKRLFRDPRERMLGGVCAGIAHFIGIDVTWVRLITVALSFASLSVACVVYGILWIVVPEANSPLQRMQMMGEEPTVDNIGRTVTHAYRRYGKNSNHHESDTPGKRIADNIVGFFAVIAKIVLIFALIIAVPVVIALAIGLLGCMIGLIALSTTWGMGFWQSEVFPEVPYVANPVVPLLAAAGYIIMIGIPVFSLCWVILSQRWKLTMGNGWKTALWVTWVVSIILATVSTGVLLAEKKVNRKQKIDRIEKVMVMDSCRNVQIHVTTNEKTHP